ncbi:MAG: Imm63 family immunity protein [Limisphaerales bacterium]
MLNLSQIKNEIERLALLIGAPNNLLPTYGRSEDFARPHIEIDNRGYHYVVIERGIELKRITTSDLDELLYHVFQSVTFDLAIHYELAHRIENQDCRRIGWENQLELLGNLSPSWQQRRKVQLENILKEHPYNDQLQQRS